MSMGLAAWVILSSACWLFELFNNRGYGFGLGILAALAAWLTWMFSGVAWEIILVSFLISAAYFSQWWLSGRQQLLQPSLWVSQHLANRYVGQVFVLTEPVKGGYGWLNIEGWIWRIRGPNLSAGATVSVRAVDGVVLLIDGKNS